MYATKSWRAVLTAIALVPVVAASAQPEPMGTAFTYQGFLRQGGVPADGDYDFIFTLYQDDQGTIQVGPTLEFDGVVGNPPPITVTSGQFTIVLDFGTGVFTGDARWLAIEVRQTGVGGYIPLGRQEVTPTPYAIHAQTAGTLDGHSLDAVDGSPTDALYVDEDGKVGIGTTLPNYELEVIGDVRATGTIYGTINNNHVETVSAFTGNAGYYLVDTSWVKVYTIGTTYTLRVECPAESADDITYWYSKDFGTPVLVYGMEPGQSADISLGGWGTLDIRINRHSSSVGVASFRGFMLVGHVQGHVIYDD